jgi:hypothetical protein
VNLVEIVLVGIVSLAAIVFLALWIRSAGAHAERRRPTWMELAVGAITDFFDALGIGSFATTTSIFRLRRMMPDELIPGTLNVGHAPAAIAEALIFVAAVSVDPALLVAGALFVAVNLDLLPGGGTALALDGWRCSG